LVAVALVVGQDMEVDKDKVVDMVVGMEVVDMEEVVEVDMEVEEEDMEPGMVVEVVGVVEAVVVVDKA